MRVWIALALLFFTLPARAGDLHYGRQLTEDWDKEFGSAPLPQSFTDLRYLIRDHRWFCDSAMEKLLQAFDTYAKDVSSGPTSAARVNGEIQALLFDEKGRKRYCFDDVFHAEVLGAIFLMSPQNYDPSYFGYHTRDGRRVPPQLGPTLFTAHLINQGQLQPPPFEYQWQMLQPKLCGVEVLGAYVCREYLLRVNPLKSPFDLGASIIHEEWHRSLDSTEFGRLQFPAFGQNSVTDLTPDQRERLMSASVLVDESIASILAIAAQHFLHRSYPAMDQVAPPSGPFYQSQGDITLRVLGKESMIEQARSGTNYGFVDFLMKLESAFGNTDRIGKRAPSKWAVDLISRIARVYFPNHKGPLDLDAISTAARTALSGEWVFQHVFIDGLVSPSGEEAFTRDEVMDEDEHTGQRFLVHKDWVGAYPDDHPDRYLKMWVEFDYFIWQIWGLEVNIQPRHQYCDAFLSYAAKAKLDGYFGACPGASLWDPENPIKPGNGGVKGSVAVHACLAVPE